MGWDYGENGHGYGEWIFQSTHPVWDGTRLVRLVTYFSALFQSTHPVWDGTQETANDVRKQHISIHPSRVGWDPVSIWLCVSPPEFQSTHPVWDGTVAGEIDLPCWADFNPPIPCGMGRKLCRCQSDAFSISIHPSRVGWDQARQLSRPYLQFQSTHPVWDGT